jgi:hypothetical protein
MCKQEGYRVLKAIDKAIEADTGVDENEVLLLSRRRWARPPTTSRVLYKLSKLFSPLSYKYLTITLCQRRAFM